MPGSKPGPGNQSARSTIAHPGIRKSFEEIANRAREVLRERGFSDAQIDRELNRSKR